MDISFIETPDESGLGRVVVNGRYYGLPLEAVSDYALLNKATSRSAPVAPRSGGTATRYVVGFAFTPNKSHVVLIQKNRPDWQAGKLNGVGGHIEDGESPVQAMAREFKEETGVTTSAEQWSQAAKLQGPLFELFVYQTVSDLAHTATSITDEKVYVLPVNLNEFLASGVPNLAWLVAVALNHGAPAFNLIAEYP